MKLRALAVTAAALVAGTMLAILGPASPAVGLYSPPLFLEIQVEPTATIVARGAAVEVRLDVTCGGPSQASIYVYVTQRVGSEIASGRGYTSNACNGQGQTVLVQVPAYSDKAFKKGTAVVDAEIYGCVYYYVCGSETDQETISLVW